MRYWNADQAEPDWPRKLVLERALLIGLTKRSFPDRSRVEFKFGLIKKAFLWFADRGPCLSSVLLYIAHSR